MPEADYTVGLRIDVDTWRGTRDGVPRLLEILAAHGIHASFFFSLGPDNMGRNLWRLFRPVFLVKMLRSKAASLYGWDILLRGTLWPGPEIGKGLAGVIRATDAAGHEIGLHAWDHYRWQTQLERLSGADIRAEIRRGLEALQAIVGHPVICSAAAGWKCNETVLREKDTCAFRYNSDCRGRSIFRPVVDGVECTVQIPVTLPTYDELIGRDGLDDAHYNAHLLSLLAPAALNVLTIHAEVEGIARSALFEDFLVLAAHRGVRFVPLGTLLPPAQQVPAGTIALAPLAGREGTVCQQAGGVAA